MDRRHGARHVRSDDRCERVDDDNGLGRAAPAAAVGDVVRDDDRHDAAVGRSVDPVYGAAARRSTQGAARQRTYALAAGYLAVWTAFSLAATALQRTLAELLLVSPMMEASSSRVSGTLLILAGIYQLTPLKLACLRACQSPLGFLMSRWRNGSSGAFRLGLEHGAYCVGCCWALMLLLFAGGVMNLLIILGLAAWVAVEKFVPFSPRGARASGAAMIALGSWMLMR